MHYTQLDKREREIISQLHSQRKSIRYMAINISRSPSTVSRELRRSIAKDGEYWALDAEFRADTRKEIPRRKRKLRENPLLWCYVQERLKCKWSPRQIAERIIYEYPMDTTMRISSEAIYTYLYLLPRGELKKELLSCLRKERLERRRRTHHYKPRSFIVDAISIHERPKETELRTIPGHWEGDLIVGKEHKSYIGTLVERTTRTLILVHLKTKTAYEVRKAFERELKTLPKQMRLSLTYDRGTEMGEHKLFAKHMKMNVFFADPHSPWQRGTNENTNGLLRQYFPKGTDLSVYSRKDLKKVQNQMNERPRAVLNFQTPKEVFGTLMESVAVRS
jgi:IS30 family transposase